MVKGRIAWAAYLWFLGANTIRGHEERAMRFPETSRAGTEAHRSALSRLDAAETHQRVSTEAHDASLDTSSEPVAANDLSAANEQVAARKAWVSWVERGY